MPEGELPTGDSEPSDAGSSVEASDEVGTKDFDPVSINRDRIAHVLDVSRTPYSNSSDSLPTTQPQFAHGRALTGAVPAKTY